MSCYGRPSRSLRIKDIEWRLVMTLRLFKVTHYCPNRNHLSRSFKDEQRFFGYNHGSVLSLKVYIGHRHPLKLFQVTQTCQRYCIFPRSSKVAADCPGHGRGGVHCAGCAGRDRSVRWETTVRRGSTCRRSVCPSVCPSVCLSVSPSLCLLSEDGMGE